MTRLAYLSVLLLALPACGNKGFGNDNIPTSDGFAEGDGSVKKGDGGGGDMPSGVSDMFDMPPPNTPSSPSITIVSPMATDIISGNNLSVTAMVTSPISSPIISVVLTDMNSTAMTTMSTTTANTYVGSRDITGEAAAGTFIITATDAANNVATNVFAFKHDAGPVITFQQPSAATAHGSVPLSITVVDTVYPFMVSGGALPTKGNGSVTATVQGTTIVLTAAVDATAADTVHLTGTIDFSTFDPALDGAQIITVVATNTHGTATKATQDFLVDNAGPVIVFKTPAAGTFIGGITPITVEITDVSAINPATVVAEFAGFSTYYVVLTPTGVVDGMAIEYSGNFDVRQLPDNYVLPSLSVRADDVLDNHGEEAEVIVVDNTPPIMTLDSPIVRVAELTTTGTIECSNTFDPLGSDSIKDGDIVKQVITVRARIQDKGNDAGGLEIERVSGIDPNSVTLIAIPAPTGNEILAVDSGRSDPLNSYCDTVNPLLIPTAGSAMSSDESIQFPMVPIPVIGNIDYVAPPTQPSPEPGICQTIGDTTSQPPALLCTSAGPNMKLTYALQYLEGSTPAIWTIPPADGTESGCVGFQFDTLNHLPEGPACLVVTGKDKTGNTAVSAPVRVCIDRTDYTKPGATPSPDAAKCVMGWTKPDCTGSYDKTTMTTSAKPCTQDPNLSFKATDVVPQF